MSTSDVTLRLQDSDTKSLTRIHNPRRLLFVRVLWVILIIFNSYFFLVVLLHSGAVYRIGSPVRSPIISKNTDGTFIFDHPETEAAQFIRDGDILIAVKGMPVSSQMSKWDVLRLMGGEIGSQVTLSVATGSEPVRSVTLTRVPTHSFIRGGLQLGFSLDFTVACIQMMDILVFLGSAVVAGLMFWRRSDDWMVLFAGWSLLAVAITESAMSLTFVVLWMSPQIGIPFTVFIAAAYLMIMLLGLLFPNGILTPRWTPLIAIGLGLWNLLVKLGDLQISSVVAALVELSFIVFFSIILIYRFRKVFSPLQRQQTKWLLLGMIALPLILGVQSLVANLLFTLGQPELGRDFAFIIRITGVLPRLFLPLSLIFALLRYRLWDIDLVINRSLVYGAASILLMAFFLGIGFLLEAVLGQANAGTAFAISIVSAGLLFSPTRKRIQRFVDRRFYGFRFDLNELNAAQQTPNIKNPGALTGRTLGAYHVLGVIGKGGMGEVYQGHGEGRIVAIKILPEPLAELDEFRKRFEREASLLAALDHPNIVKIYDAGRSEGVYYIVLEFVEGEQLADLIRQRGAIPLEEVRPFVHDFSTALDYAHQQRLVHRDIKPSNIMIRLKPDGTTQEAVLMDFGIAKIQDAKTSITGTGAIGTIEYMAPEQIMAAKEVDHRADIYGLGVVLYEILTGERPFKGSPGQILFAHLQQPPPDPRILCQDILQYVADAIMKAMAKKPEDRFQTVGEFAMALVHMDQRKE